VSLAITISISDFWLGLAIGAIAGVAAVVVFAISWGQQKLVFGEEKLKIQQDLAAQDKKDKAVTGHTS